eukprot:TRINITY_DN5136_c0_g1_i1.p1 TRINITY_DN5136_c0_g1~~TRINITY_DN5136_c0_g1_i1.p1  ORF type:complete len:490 (-),score=185.68 TRINITY_DN5136_c0_g1_i1:92-1561(-)
MSVDLKKFGADIKNACKEVTGDKCETNWALFGYEGQTNILKLVSTGEDGLEELVEDFNPSQIQYAFLKVEDPKTSLPKFVLINWQGESAPGSRKGSCAMHLRDVEQFMAGHHLTYVVRNEDELDINLILEKVSKVTASSFNFKQKPTGMEHSPAPVGTAHKKINPMAELPNMGLREKFWEADQEQEKERIVQEREMREKEQREVESERRKREEKENKKRDEHIKEREMQINTIRENEAGKAKVEDRAAWEEQRRADVMDADERNNRSEMMRKNRNREAAELIASRGGEAKKIFQRNSSQGQMNFTAPPGPAPPKPLPLSQPAPAPILLNATPPVSPPANNNTPSISDIAPPPPAFESSPSPEERNEVVVLTEDPLEWNNDEAAPSQNADLHHASPATISPSPTPREEDEEELKESTDSPALDSYGTCAVALYDYQASDETEISFDPGQIISHIDQIDPGWWQGLGPQGNYGLFPANYVEIIDNTELQIM